MQALRDAMSQISKTDAILFGVSTDSVESHKKFAEQEKLNFPLLADSDKKMAEAYGVLMPGGFAKRVTFVIDGDGVITHIDRTVNEQFERGEGKLTSRHGENLARILSGWKARIGEPIPVFSLPDADGKTVSNLAPGKKASVILFTARKCPAARAYDARLVELATDPAFKEVAFLGVSSDARETAEDARAHRAESGIPFPIGIDQRGELAERFGVTTSPTVWVLDPKGVAVYAGRIDDSQDPDRVKVRYLRDALAAALSGQKVAVSQTRPAGCRIVSRKR